MTAATDSHMAAGFLPIARDRGIAATPARTAATNPTATTAEICVEVSSQKYVLK
jgi:hypothetical protein